MVKVLKETIRPFSDLETKLEELRKQCREEDCAVILARDAQADSVLMSYDAYREMSGRLELPGMLAEAESDVQSGRIAPIDSTFEDLREALSERS